MNVNIPDVAPERIAVQGRRKFGDELIVRRDPRGEAYIWIGTMRKETAHAPRTDLAAVASGAVAITPLFLDLTYRPTITRLRKAFGKGDG